MLHPCSGWGSMYPYAFACSQANMKKKVVLFCVTFISHSNDEQILSAAVHLSYKSSSYSEYMKYSPVVKHFPHPANVFHIRKSLRLTP